MTVARYFDEEKAAGQFFPGVPARDLEDAEYDALPRWLQKSIDDSPMYRKSKVGTEAPATPKKKAAHKSQPKVKATVHWLDAEKNEIGSEPLDGATIEYTPKPEGEEE